MKIQISSQSWKKAVSQALSLVGKSSGNPNESCILVKGTNEGSLELLVVEAGVHNTTIALVDAVVEDPSEAYIQYSSLDKLNSQLDKGELSIEIANSKITLSVDNLGSISEPVFHNQDAFKGMLFTDNDYTAINDVGSLINLIQNRLKPILDWKGGTTKRNQVDFLLDGDNSYAFGKIALSGYATYKFICNNHTDFSIDTSLLKNLMFLLDGNDVELSTSNKYIAFRSSKGSIIVAKKKAVEEASLKFQVGLSEKEPDSHTFLNGEQFSKAIRWQSYNSEDGDSITLWSSDEEFFIKGSKVDQPSKVPYGELEEFSKLSLPISNINSTASYLSREELVELRQVDTGIESCRAALFVVDKDDITSTFYLYEQPSR